MTPFDYCATSDDDNLEVSIDAKGTIVHIETSGRGVPLIFVNGLQVYWKNAPGGPEDGSYWHGTCGRRLSELDAT